MTKLQLLLLIAAIVSALGVVTSQHKARKLFIELQREKDRAQQMEVEWGQLQLEQSTLATLARVEGIATEKLQMRLPKSSQIQFVRGAPHVNEISNGVALQP
ncbi:MAG: cell division protein FtsL [Gallionellaceae bacterium]